MSITVICPKCNIRLTLGDDRAGERMECPNCDAPIRVPPAVPSAPRASAPKGDESPIDFLCPHCRSRMKIARAKAGAEVKCPRCDQKVIVPTPVEKPPLAGILLDAEPPAPAPHSPPPVEFDYEADEEEDDDYDLYHIRKRRRQRRNTAIWRLVTLAALGVSMVCFFLPWVRYSVVVPIPRQLLDSRSRDPLEMEFGNQSGVQIRRDRIEFEFASQSGLQVAFAFASFQPALDRWIKKEMEQTESEWRKVGKNPFDEWLKRSKPFMAPWLLLYPLALGIAFLVTLVSEPARGPCLGVGILALATGLLLLIQFGMFGPPVVGAFYDHMMKEGSPGAAFLVSLVLDVRYTFWFGLAVFGIVVTIITQGVFWTLGQWR